jgi:hypothetical protein
VKTLSLTAGFLFGIFVSFLEENERRQKEMKRIM